MVMGRQVDIFRWIRKVCGSAAVSERAAVQLADMDKTGER